MSTEASVRKAYEMGRTTFMGIELLVAPGALVPRAETELLGNTALKVLREMLEPSLTTTPLPKGEGFVIPPPSNEGGASARVIDMCCGAGNLVCAIAHHVPHSRVWASDLTDRCVDLARRNVTLHSLGDRVSVHQGDLFEAFAELGLEGAIDAVVCNPPYISDKRLEGDRAHLLDLEPREAFAAGPYGLNIYMRVVKDALAFLRPGGVLLFEVGLGQDRQVKILFERSKAYENVRVVQNDAGNGRVVFGHRKMTSCSPSP